MAGKFVPFGKAKDMKQGKGKEDGMDMMKKKAAAKKKTAKKK